MVARSTHPDDDPIKVDHMRGQLLADGLVMVKYTSENHGRFSDRTSLWGRAEAGHWQIFHHQGRSQTARSRRRIRPTDKWASHVNTTGSRVGAVPA